MTQLFSIPVCYHPYCNRPIRYFNRSGIFGWINAWHSAINRVKNIQTGDFRIQIQDHLSIIFTYLDDSIINCKRIIYSFYISTIELFFHTLNKISPVFWSIWRPEIFCQCPTARPGHVFGVVQCYYQLCPKVSLTAKNILCIHSFWNGIKTITFAKS